MKHIAHASEVTIAASNDASVETVSSDLLPLRSADKVRMADLLGFLGLYARVKPFQRGNDPLNMREDEYKFHSEGIFGILQQLADLFIEQIHGSDPAWDTTRGVQEVTTAIQRAHTDASTFLPDK